jgi:RNA polymerase sigma factor (TIGR02999 family)
MSIEKETSQQIHSATQLLNQVSRDPSAADKLLPLVYEELRKLASARMAREKSGNTLQATALVHEAYLRLVDKDQCEREWEGRAHFFKAASEAMRRILIDRARRKQCERHGGDLERENIEHAPIATPSKEETLLAVNEALDVLEQEDSRKASVVKLRYFVGLSNKETAETLGISLASVERDWAFAKAWLFDWLKRNR